MKYLLFIFMLSIGFGSLIENITESYDDGMPKTVKYYKSISNNHLELTMIKEYYENGKISKEENYRNGELNGKWTIFWNGDFYGGIKETGYYKDGKKNGKWSWFNESELDSSKLILHTEENYKNGILNGKRISYFENGQILEIGNYKNGEMDGMSVRYYENGQIYQEVHVKNGEMDGKGVRYYENGQIQQQVNFLNGSFNGERIYYNEDGTIDRVLSYKNGILID